MDLEMSVLHDAKQGQRGHQNEHAEQRDGQQAHRAQQPGGILIHAISTTTSGSRTTRLTKNTWIQACGTEE